MAATIQFVTDSKGRRKSALVPIKTWEHINEQNKQLQRKIEVLTGIAAGIMEVKTARAEGRSLQSLSDFLGEG